MQVENFKTNVQRSTLELCILGLLSHEEAYANTLIIKLKEQNLIEVEGIVFPILTQLKNAGLLNYRWDEAGTEPSRKIYSITQLGINHLQQIKQDWRETVKNIETILK